jgi:eukaryotic-like serine/threonine-protein kinase
MRSPSSPSVIKKPVLHEGEVLAGRYRIETCLGSGGMATVYRATHLGLEQPVAIKIVTATLRDVPGVAARFMREARAATHLKGEHVVRVIDVGKTDDGLPFLVMELLEGKDLAELFEDRFQPSIEEAVDLILQACEALAEVHGLGIVHRDLKPANLFVVRGADGLPFLKLIDFGISRFDAPLTGLDAMTITNPDVVMGSPRYMPPEQMEAAGAVDSRSDIWGLGAILYEMLAGRAPFDGESLFDIYAAAVRSLPVPPSRARADVPRGLDDVILRCLEVDPNERPADVAALALALAPFGDDRAMARAESIARVLQASRARGDGEGARVTPRVDLAPSARMRRRKQEARRRRILTASMLVVAVAVGAVFARPLARSLTLVPSVSVSGAAAATPVAAPREPIPAPVPTAEPPVMISPVKAVREPTRADVPERPQASRVARPEAPETVPVPDEPPTSTPEPSDSLFEERK